MLIVGGIGSGIEYTIIIGMLPWPPPEDFGCIGNASLAGACAMIPDAMKGRSCAVPVSCRL